jgi:hypothetical protein
LQYENLTDSEKQKAISKIRPRVEREVKTYMDSLQDTAFVITKSFKPTELEPVNAAYE